MKHPGGRPTKYNPSFINEVDNYLKTTGKEQMHLPKIESFCIWLGIGKTTLYEWAKKYPEFQNALEQILLYQGVQLQDDGIYGGKEVNATIVKLLLQNNHGMREKTDSEVNISGNVTINMDELIGLTHASAQATGSNSPASGS